MRTTGKYDCNNQEIFEGDKVINVWGWFNWNGKLRTKHQIHTITVKKAHMMANGEMHDDGGGKIFCLGSAYNFWKGSEVQKITKEDADKIGIKDDVSFFFDETGKAIKVTDQHFLGLNDDDWEKEKERRKKFFTDFTTHTGGQAL